MRRRLLLAPLLLLATSAAPASDPIADARRRLGEAKAAARTAATQAAALERSAADERDAEARARKQEAAVARRIRGAEADLQAARARVALVEGLLARQRAGLAERQAPVANLLGALEGFARRPPVAAVVQPGSIDDLVHLRAVLSAIEPVVRARTAALRGDLAETRRLRGDAALAAQGLRDGRQALLAERRALATLRASHADRALALGRNALAQSDRAIAMGEAARDIVDRMSEIADLDATAAGLVEMPGPPIFDVAATAPARPAYRLPVRGRLVTGFGEISPSGVRARGLTLAVAPGAGVVAPAAGRIVFARRFRGYGTIVILDHGGGWSTLVTGLADATVARGQRVAAGSAIGRAEGSEEPRITVELRRRLRPVDLATLIG